MLLRLGKIAECMALSYNVNKVEIYKYRCKNNRYVMKEHLL